MNPCSLHLKNEKMLKRIKFIRDTAYPNGRIDKKGVERYVTRRHADWLIEIKAAEIISDKPEVKEEKQVVETKEEKAVPKRRTKKAK